MQTYIRRNLHTYITTLLREFPAVAILGPRQCGKTTLAHQIVKKRARAVYLDLERPSDLRKLDDPELYLGLQKGRLVCLDEIQRKTDLFPVLRSLIDDDRKNGRFLILGSASRDLIRQSSETLAGRVAFVSLTPFLLSEVSRRFKNPWTCLLRLWLRGGFPESVLSGSDESSMRWRQNFVQTFLERDIPQLGFNIPAKTLQRLWQMLAHVHGQQLNSSRLGEAIGVSHTTIRSYIDLLIQTFVVRELFPFYANIKKRLVKSPKVYVRDSGILHALLDIETYDSLLGHPVYGASWEGLVVENLISELPDWKPFYFRTASGAELDLILTKGRSRLAVECKASSAPEVTKGFWSALRDLDIKQAWIIAPVKESYPIEKHVHVCNLETFLKSLKASRRSTT
ncbi:MAG: ATP-binding protein [Deltaproteobacteria bacterium]|nr:ATP-binding protein [Deltaproteobacteria bacterium]